MWPPSIGMYVNVCLYMNIAADDGHIEYTQLEFPIKINYTFLACVSFIRKCTSLKCHISRNV